MELKIIDPPIPILISHGSMIIKLMKLRKKTTSRVGISREAKRIEIPGPAKKIPEARIQIAPRVVGARLNQFFLIVLFWSINVV